MNCEIPEHEKFMRRCLELASLGMGHTAPNPMVGAVLVSDGKIIGEGFHHAFGLPHAEINAIRSVSDSNFLTRATLYVNLEPCSHYGKTPPCVETILQKKIPHVVIGAADPDPRVNGRGIQILRNAGCRVETGILEQECRFLNRRFYKFHEQHRPWVILKWAQTRDGFIDRIRTSPETDPEWITDEVCRVLVHKWRTEEQAILVGTRTALMDNPKLNARLWKGRQPVRVVIDRNLSLPNHLHLFDGSQETWVFTETDVHKPKHRLPVRYIKADFVNLPDVILTALHQHGIQSLIVEGGTRTLQRFLNAGLWDEARVFTGNKHFGAGISAPAFHHQPSIVTMLGKHRLEIFYFRSEQNSSGYL